MCEIKHTKYTCSLMSKSEQKPVLIMVWMFLDTPSTNEISFTTLSVDVLV